MKILMFAALLALSACSSQGIDREFSQQHGYDAMRSMQQSTGTVRNGID